MSLAGENSMIWGEFGKKSLEFIDRPITQDARITILDGSVRSSKTVSCMPKLLEYCARGPEGTIAITGVSKQTIKRNVLNDVFDTVGNENYHYNQSTGEMTLFRRACQVIGVKDEGSEKYIRGGTYAGWFGDEATAYPQSSFTQMLNRMSATGAKAYLTTNPDSPYHYLYTDYIDNKELLKAGTVRRIHFELNDNPNLSDEYKDFIRSAYSGLWYKRMILGLWVAAEGAIYDMFSDAENLITADELPKRFDHILIGVDYGAGNPTVFIKIGVKIDKTGKPAFYVFDEWYHDARVKGSKTAVQYKQALIDFMAAPGCEAETEYKGNYEIFPDPSAETFEIELQSSSRGQPLRVNRSNNEVLPGINTVASYIGQRRLKIVGNKCPESCKEVYSYIWDKKAQLTGEDAPVKQHDHCLDATRYPIHTAFPASNLQRLFATCR